MAYFDRVRFIETPLFTAAVRTVCSEASFRALQLSLVLQPDRGPIIRGSGGLRKLRWAGSGRGKRGGIRVIYHWYPTEETILLLYLYPKNVAEDLTPSQLRILRRLVEEELE